MSSCSTLLTGLAAKCEGNLGGIKQIAIGDWHSVDFSSMQKDADEVITALTASTKFVTFAAAKNTAGITSTLTKDDTTGVAYWTNELTFNINHLDEKKRMQIKALSLGHLAVIVTDRNGVSHFLGENDYVVASASTAQTGQRADDGNFYSITLTDVSEDLPHVIDDTVIAGLVTVLPVE